MLKKPSSGRRFKGAPPSSIDRVGRRPRLARALTTFERIETESFVDAVLEVAAALASGLAHAHDQGILHRDLKPANIIITDDGEPMLVDFNLSEDLKQRSDSLWSMAGGTLPYMSPEQIDEYLRIQTTVDQRSDLYSLAIIIFELLTGKLPFPSATTGTSVWKDARVARTQAPPSARLLNKAVSRRVDVVIRKCLECAPEKRYGSARELHDDLKCCIKGRPLIHSRDPYLHERIGQWGERNATRLFGGGLTVFAAFCAISVHSLNEFEARREANVVWATEQPLIDRSRFELAEAVIDRRAFDVVRAKAMKHLAPFDDGIDLESNRRYQHLTVDERQQLKRNAATIAVLAAGASLVEADTKIGDERSRCLSEAEQWTKRVVRLAGGANWKTIAILKAMSLEVAGAKNVHEAREMAEATNPVDPFDAQLASLVYAMERRFAPAKALLMENEEQSPDRVFGAFVAGFCLRELGEPQMAVQAWDYCAHERPTEPQFRRLLGLTQIRFLTSVFRNPQIPLRNLDAAVGMNSNDAESLLARSYVYSKIEQQYDAMQDAKDALRIGFSPYYTWSAIKRLAAGTADVAAAAEADKELKSKTPKSFEDWLEIGKHGPTPNGRLAACERAIELRPWSIDANAEYLEQMIAAGVTGNHCFAAVERARRIAPDLWKMRALCGRVLAMQGRDELAFAEVDQLLASPNFRKQRIAAATAVVVEVVDQKPSQVDRAAERFADLLDVHQVSDTEWERSVDKNPPASAHFENFRQRIFAALGSSAEK